MTAEQATNDLLKYLRKRPMLYGIRTYHTRAGTEHFRFFVVDDVGDIQDVTWMISLSLNIRRDQTTGACKFRGGNPLPEVVWLLSEKLFADPHKLNYRNLT